jgi:hypothetical protein
MDDAGLKAEKRLKKKKSEMWPYGHCLMLHPPPGAGAHMPMLLLMCAVHMMI